MSKPKSARKPDRKKNDTIIIVSKRKPVTHPFIKDIRKQPPRIFYSVKEVCAVLCLGRTSVFSLLRQNKIASEVHGRRRLIYRQSVKEFAASLRKNGGAV
nr:excisionase family DNA-binding protein [Novosphingobium fluoreni]